MNPHYRTSTLHIRERNGICLRTLEVSEERESAALLGTLTRFLLRVSQVKLAHLSRVTVGLTPLPDFDSFHVAREGVISSTARKKVSPSGGIPGLAGDDMHKLKTRQDNPILKGHSNNNNNNF